jgi:hypothetical protein
VRAPRWSPDGSRLALLARRGDGFEALIWQRSTGKTTLVPMPKDRVINDNATLQWSADGQQLFLSTRDPGWRKQAAQGFAKLTTEPIIVMSSTNPFMSWEELQRLDLQQNVAVFDLRTNQTREVLSGAKLRSFEVTGDAALVRYMDDITTKTDYDVIRGNDNMLKLLGMADATLTPRMARCSSAVWTTRKHASCSDPHRPPRRSIRQHARTNASALCGFRVMVTS